MTEYAPCECGTWPTPSDFRTVLCRVCGDYRPAAWYERARAATFGEPVPPHLFATPRVDVSPRRVMDVPDEPGAVGRDFPGAVS